MLDIFYFERLFPFVTRRIHYYRLASWSYSFDVIVWNEILSFLDSKSRRKKIVDPRKLTLPRISILMITFTIHLPILDHDEVLVSVDEHAI